MDVRGGRPPVTSRAELEQVGLALFTERGFASTTVDDLASAAGIGRRTFFRYFASKNDLVWGDFDAGLDGLRARLAQAPADQPLLDAIREAVLAFNALDPVAEPSHRQRMDLILRVPALQAHSTLRYAAWREVVSRFAAGRLGIDEDALLAQLIGQVSLAAALTAYEQWLEHPGTSLPDLLDEALRSLDGRWAVPAGRARRWRRT